MTNSLFNEKNYLQNPKAVQAFEMMHQLRLENWKKEEKKYSKVLKKYDLFVEEVARLLKDLGYHSVLDCSIMLSYLISNGFLSQDFVFKDGSPNPETEIQHRLGTSIIRGEGCCRNYSDMQEDVFRKLGLFSSKLYCYEKFFLTKNSLNKPANHVINLVSFEGNLYGIDLYNHNRLFRFQSPLILKEVSSKSSIRLRYKPYYEIIMGEANYEEILQKLKDYQAYSQKPFLNPFDYEDQIRYLAIRRMKEDYDTLYQFHEKTKALKKEIVSGLSPKM